MSINGLTLNTEVFMAWVDIVRVGDAYTASGDRISVSATGEK